MPLSKVTLLRSAGEQVVEQLPVMFEVAQQKTLGERTLVPEVIEEAALGQADLGDDLLDRGRRETLGQHGRLRHGEDLLAGLPTFAARLFEHLAT